MQRERIPSLRLGKDQQQQQQKQQQQPPSSMGTYLFLSKVKELSDDINNLAESKELQFFVLTRPWAFIWAGERTRNILGKVHTVGCV